MPTIALIGPTPSNLLLALSLKAHKGNNVTLYSDRTSNQIGKSNTLMPTLGLAFSNSLKLEEKYQLPFGKRFPSHNSVSFTVAHPGDSKKNIKLQETTSFPFQCIDPRLKLSLLFNEFEARGGEIVFTADTSVSLSKITRLNDLTIVGEKQYVMGRPISEDNVSPPSFSHIVTGGMYVKNMSPVKGFTGLRAYIIPGMGGYYTVPVATLNNDSYDMMLFTGEVDSKFAFLQHPRDPSSKNMLEKAVSLLQEYLPKEAARCTNLELVDNSAIFVNAYKPSMKQPVFQLRCGQYVLGTDAFMRSNTIFDGNNAAKCAEIYFNNIIKRGDKPFDVPWMQKTFEDYWLEHGNAAENWLPLAQHVMTTQHNSFCAKDIINSFSDPNILFSLKNKSEEEILQRKNEQAFLDDTTNPAKTMWRAMVK